MNRVVIVGRLTRDPELKKTNSGSSVVSFTVAVDNPRGRSRDGQQDNGQPKASFIPVTAWNATAENVARFMKKGSLVGVDGRLNQRSYQARDGHNVNVIEIIAEQVQFLDRKGEGPANQDNSGYTSQTSSYSNSHNDSGHEDNDGNDSPSSLDTTDDELPF